MKKQLITLSIILVLSMVLSPFCLAAGGNYDTLASWGIRVAVPDGATALLDGSDDCYYIYAEEPDAIPYVMLTAYSYDSADEFIPDFTEYMSSVYDDLTVTADAAQKRIGDKSCWEIDYGYTVSGYDVKDRRIVIEENGMIYLFGSKEVAELDLTIGDMLEEVVANAEFLPIDGTFDDDAEEMLANAYLYCEEDGMPKYWLDLTGAIIDNLVLHCYFRSSDPTFYETLYILDLETADIEDDFIEIYNVYDEYGLDHSNWFDSFTIWLEDDGMLMEVERDESTLAGGSEDNLLTGSYPMEPMDAGVVFEYYQDDGQLKYWMDLGEEDIELHCMFRSGDPEYYEEVFTLDMATAEYDGDYSVSIQNVYNSAGDDVSDWFESLILNEVQGAIIMDVERDESTLAGGADDNILTGVYMLEPRTYLVSPEEGPFTPNELAELAQRYYFEDYGFFPPEADVEDNGDGTYTIHLYEIVDLDGLTHTATSAWYTVDEYGVGTDDLRGQDIDLRN